MVDTYARVMRATDGPADRRTTRSRAPRRPGVVRDSVTDTAAVTGIAGGGAPAVAAQAALVTQAAVPGSPAEVTFAAAVAAFTAGREALRRMQPGAGLRAVSRGACDLSRRPGRRLSGMGLHGVRRSGDYRPARARVRPGRQCRQGRLSTKNPARIPKDPGEPGRPVLFRVSASGTAFNPVIRVKHGVSA